MKWLDNLEESRDRCLHGRTFVKIGNEVVCDADTGEWTLSSTALYLMRTVTENYEVGDYGSQLIPCCGHFFMADPNHDDFVIINGCPHGIDWTVRHLENGQIKHITQRGEEAVIDKGAYVGMVGSFADQVERFYQTSKPKEIPDNEFDRQGYEAFWKEWNTLRADLQ